MTSVSEGVMTKGRTVKIVSLNSSGLNAAIRHTKIMTHIKTLKADIMFLQETHL